jgi:hypothetical protein
MAIVGLSATVESGAEPPYLLRGYCLSESGGDR